MANDSHVSQTRIAAIVVIAVFPLWMAFSALGGWLGLSPSYAVLGDLFALAAFVWAMIVLFRIWRARQGKGV